MTGRPPPPGGGGKPSSNGGNNLPAAAQRAPPPAAAAEKEGGTIDGGSREGPGLTARRLRKGNPPAEGAAGVAAAGVVAVVVGGGGGVGPTGGGTSRATATRGGARGRWAIGVVGLLGAAALARVGWEHGSYVAPALAGGGSRASSIIVVRGAATAASAAASSSSSFNPANATETTADAPQYLPNPSAARWADTPSGRGVCRELLPWGAPRTRDEHGGPYTYPRDSFNAIWDAIRPAVLNVSYHPFHGYDPGPNATDEQEQLREFRIWTKSLFHFYTYERLRRSQAHPPSLASVQRLLQAVSDRLHHPDRAGPIRVAVMGGSVAVGRGCQYSPFSFTDTSRRCHDGCNYVSRLDRMLNMILFPSANGFNNTTKTTAASHVFEVTNLAAGGSNSEVGAMALAYDLIPHLQNNPPHVVISSYSANDSSDPDLRKTFRVDQQAFVRAAHNLWPCDDHLPLVLLADDYYGPDSMANAALEQTGSIYKTASYHNVMAVTYSNTARHWHSLQDGSALFGTGLGPHLGMGFHYGQSWVLFFNLLAALHDACQDIALDADVDDDDDANTGIGGEASGTSSANAPIRKRWSLDELPTKYRGRYEDSVYKIQRAWAANVQAKERRCQQQVPPTNRSREEGIGGVDSRAASGAAAASSSSRYRTRVCEYAWMANKATPYSYPPAVRDAMNHILVSNQGWTVSSDGTPGEPVSNARTGWATNTSQASFTVEIKDLRQAVTSFTVLSMKSYGPDWINSTLRATVEVTPRIGPAIASGVLDIDGYHDIKTSVNFPHRLSLAGGGAKVGDTIRVAFELIHGRTFKVSGLAFCQLDDV